MITGMLLASIGLAGCGKKSEDDITNKEIYQDDLEPLTEEELKDHYKIQLQVYGEAAEKLLGKPVSHLYLWSFTYGKAIEVEKM